MRGIFTYPNNSATNFVDPQYYGDANSGFLKRINDFVANNYMGHQTAIVASTDNLIKAIAKNANAQYAAANNNAEQNDPNMTFYELWRQPLLLFPRELAVNDIDSILPAVTQGNNFTYLTLKATANGSYWAMPEHTHFTFNWTPIDNDTDFFVEHETPGSDNSVILLNTDANGTPLILSDTQQNATTITNGAVFPQDVGGTYNIVGNTIISKTNGDLQWCVLTDDNTGFSNSDVVQFGKLRNEVHGNDIEVGVDYYLQKINDNKTIRLFEDSNLSTPAEQSAIEFKSFGTNNATIINGALYSDTLGNSASTNNTVIFTFGDSNTSGSLDVFNDLVAHQEKFSFTANNETFQRFPVYVKTNTSSGWDYNSGYRFYEGDYDERTIAWARVFSSQGAPPNQNFTAYRMAIYDSPTGGISTVDIDSGTSQLSMSVRVPEACQVTSFNSGTSTYLDPAPNDATATVHVDATARYRVDGDNHLAGQVKHFGAIGWFYQTGANTSAFGAHFAGRYYKPNTQQELNTQSGETQAQFTYTNNGQNTQINGVELTGGNWGMYITDDDMTLITSRTADTYSPPALTVAEQQDVFDLDDQWNTTGLDFSVFGAIDKTFPTTVTPQDITVRVVSPSATTMSQNGTKFTRTAGYSKYSIDVTYPPMTAEEYLDYNGFINTLNGQKHPFYFNIKQNNTNLFGRPGDYTINGLRYREDASAGANSILIEGFATLQEDAIQRGELLINGGYYGNLVTAASSTDANAYGEARFRLATPLPSGQSISNQIYNDPFHIIVTLDTDTVEVSRDTAGFYYLSLTFTADNFK